MAIKNRKCPDKNLIHHSDRGFQYCSNEYVSFAEENGLTMSMTEQYDPYENAIAERINRTLKYELKKLLKTTINLVYCGVLLTCSSTLESYSEIFLAN